MPGILTEAAKREPVASTKKGGGGEGRGGGKADNPGDQRSHQGTRGGEKEGEGGVHCQLQ